MQEQPKITVTLRPMVVPKKVGNLTVKRSVKQDYVDIETEDGKKQTWGYVSSIPGLDTFLPLSGFPMELTAEVQRQINELRGYKEGEGPKPPQMVANGRTAAEQEADAAADEFDEIYYEDDSE